MLVNMIYLCILMISVEVLSVFGQGPTVTIPDGQLVGTEGRTVGSNMTYYAFRGIPFAKPPIGNLRFAPPVKNDPWTGVLDATRDKNMCTQFENSYSFLHPGSVLGSEDCLYINVYSRDLNGSSPVMVWIYEGAFIHGDSSYNRYAPDYLLEENVTYVSFNYRLGVFGFLSTGDLVAPGNWGLKDQILALQWVKNNIAHFGGDPNKITIFGESAGSASVSYLLQTNLTNGLFNGAIMESGTSLCLWALTREARRKAFGVGEELELLGILESNSSTLLIEKLRTVDFNKLKNAELEVISKALMWKDSFLAGLPIGVTTEPDHDGAVVTGKSHQKLLEGNFTKMPIIVGFNSNEGVEFAATINSDVKRVGLLSFYDLYKQYLAPYDLSHNINQKTEAGMEINDHYVNGSLYTALEPALAKFLSVDQFERPIRETVNRMANYTNVYYYKFSYEGSLGDPNNAYPGVAHAEELNFLFVKNRSASAEDVLTRSRLVRLWTNFAKTGNPTPSTNDSILNGLVWEPNTPSTNTNISVKYLDIDRNLSMQNNPCQSDWSFYQEIYRKFGVPPHDTY